MKKRAHLKQESRAICFYTMDFKKWQAEYEDHLVPPKSYIEWFISNGTKMPVSNKLVEDVFVTHPAVSHYMALSILEDKYIDYKEGDQISFCAYCFQ